MNDLRKAAEMALGVLLDPKTRADEVAEAVKVIRQALDLETAIERGTKAWADVPNASEWVEELRGNVDNVDMSEKRVHKSDKSIHELDLEAPLTVNGVPLYPKREWVGLTDEDMEALFLNEDGVRFARYIEAKLKEKNNG